VERVTETGRFEARREHERYVLVRTSDGRLWQHHGSCDTQDAAGNLIVQPAPQSSRCGLTPHGVLQLCVLSSLPFAPVEEPWIADVRPHIKVERRKP
jgi:hypothetical protein